MLEETPKTEPKKDNPLKFDNNLDQQTKSIDLIPQQDLSNKMVQSSEQIAQTKSNNEKVTVEVQAQNETHTIKITRTVTVLEIAKCIDDTIDEISKSKIFVAKPVKLEIKTPPVIPPETVENPVRAFAEKIGVDPDAFEKLKLIAIKNDDVQLLKPTKLKPSESCYLLLAVNEFALNKTSMQFEDWRELCQASNIKSPTPFYKIAGNAKSNGHIDKKKYDNSREMVLSPKGVEVVKKAIERAVIED